MNFSVYSCLFVDLLLIWRGRFAIAKKWTKETMLLLVVVRWWLWCDARDVGRRYSHTVNIIKVSNMATQTAQCQSSASIFMAEKSNIGTPTHAEMNSVTWETHLITSTIVPRFMRLCCSLWRRCLQSRQVCNCVNGSDGWQASSGVTVCTLSLVFVLERSNGNHCVCPPRKQGQWKWLFLSIKRQKKGHPLLLHHIILLNEGSINRTNCWIPHANLNTQTITSLHRISIKRWSPYAYQRWC